MRCVFDTSVLVSALLVPDGKPRQALRLAAKQAAILTCSLVLAELYDVLARRKFHRYVTDETIREYLSTLGTIAERIEATVRIAACRDPKDDKFLELAVSGRATHLITADDDLLVLNPFRGVAILTPDQFLRLQANP